MSKLWICTRSDEEDFKVGKVYKLDSNGELIDDAGWSRLPPTSYNTYSHYGKTFKEVDIRTRVGGRIESNLSLWFQKNWQKYKADILWGIIPFVALSIVFLNIV